MSPNVTADVTTESTDHHQTEPTLEALANVPTTDEAPEGGQVRECTVETTFGCITDAMGFRYPTMRGLTGIQTKWQLTCLAWNLKRAFSLDGLTILSARNGEKGTKNGLKTC